MTSTNKCHFTCKTGSKADLAQRICKPPLRTQAISAKENSYTCALLENDKIKCWGTNDVGQLGLGHKDTLGDEMEEMGDALPYVDLGSASNTKHKAQAIAFGSIGKHTCAILKNGRFNHGPVKCWGAGHKDTLGRIAAG